MWLIALAFATKYDLQISLSIADSNSSFGNALEIFGEPPAILFTSFNFSLMFSHFIKKQNKSAWDVIFAVITLIFTVGTVIFTVNTTADYLANQNGSELKSSLPVIITVSAIIALGIIWIALSMSKKTVDKYFDVALRCVGVGVITLAVIWAFKLCWGRVRFRQLDQNFANFTKWYLPQGFTGYFSFPSGHTANSTVIFATTYYFKFMPKKLEKLKPVIYLFLSLWIVLMAFSRVLVGAHYLSDVLFGGAITFLIVYILRPRNNGNELISR